MPELGILQFVQGLGDVSIAVVAALLLLPYISKGFLGLRRNGNGNPSSTGKDNHLAERIGDLVDLQRQESVARQLFYKDLSGMVESARRDHQEILTAVKEARYDHH